MPYKHRKGVDHPVAYRSYCSDKLLVVPPPSCVSIAVRVLLRIFKRNDWRCFYRAPVPRPLDILLIASVQEDGTASFLTTPYGTPIWLANFAIERRDIIRDYPSPCLEQYPHVSPRLTSQRLTKVPPVPHHIAARRRMDSPLGPVILSSIPKSWDNIS